MAQMCVIKGFFHEQGKRFERWLNPDTCQWQSIPPNVGMMFEQARFVKQQWQNTLPNTVSLFLVPLFSHSSLSTSRPASSILR